MHHDYLMIATHLGSEVGPLARSMNASAEITLNRKPLVYSTPLDLRTLKLVCEKYKESRIYADVLTHNHSLRSKPMYGVCRYLYYLGDPRRTLTSLIQQYNYTPQKAYDYYSFRLQRLAFMAKQTPKAILLTWDQLHEDKAEKDIRQFLRLKSPLYFSIEGEDLKYPPAEGGITQRMCDIYTKYLARIQKSLGGHSDVGTGTSQATVSESTSREG